MPTRIREEEYKFYTCTPSRLYNARKVCPIFVWLVKSIYVLLVWSVCCVSSLSGLGVICLVCLPTSYIASVLCTYISMQLSNLHVQDRVNSLLVIYSSWIPPATPKGALPYRYTLAVYILSKNMLHLFLTVDFFPITSCVYTALTFLFT